MDAVVRQQRGVRLVPALLVAFDAFRLRSFRFQWSADAIAGWATEMETVILGWYVLVDTGSPFLVGLIGALRFGGTLLSPLYGVVADRIDRRAFLIVLRLLHAVQAGAIMALALAGWLEPWHAFVIAGVGGLVRMGENVVRQSLIADVVPSAALMNAVSLSRTTLDTAKIVGAMAGAALLARLGLGVAFVAVTALFVVSAVLVLGITIGEQPPLRSTGSPVANLRAGFSYMRQSQTITAIMFLAFLVNLTVFPLTNGLMPVVAKSVFDAGPDGLALLLACASTGALAGSMALAALSRIHRPERVMLLSILAWHGLLLLFTQVQFFPVALAVLAVYGAIQSAAMITMSAVLLSTAAAEFRGRVMGVRMMAVYGLPMGLLLGGALSERLGVQPALAVSGLLGLGLTIGAGLVWPALWRGSAARSIGGYAGSGPVAAGKVGSADQSLHEPS